MKNKKIIITLICVFAVVVTAFLVYSQVESRRTLPLGVYATENKDDTIFPQRVVLKENNEFVFTYSFLSSYLNTGKYKKKSDTLILSTDDGLYEYVFQIKGDTLIFNASKSSPISTFKDEQSLTDGAVFKFTGEAENTFSLKEHFNEKTVVLNHYF